MRVSDHQRNIAFAAGAFSAVAVALCAITLTIQAMISGIGVTRVLDQEALERQVAGYARSTPSADRDGVACPTAVEAKVGNKFTCEVADGDTEKVEVTVISDQGELEMTYG